MLYPLIAAARLRREPQRMLNGVEDGSAPPVAPRMPSEIADASTTAHLRQLVAGGIGRCASIEEDHARRRPTWWVRPPPFKFSENSPPCVHVAKGARADISIAALLGSCGTQRRASQTTLLGRSFSGVLSGPLAFHAGGSLAGKDSIDASSTVSNSWGAFSDPGTDSFAAVLLPSPIFAGLLMSIPSDNRNAEQMRAWNSC
jgi:hypothetical protein